MNDEHFISIARDTIAINGSSHRNGLIEVDISAPVFDRDTEAFGWRCQYRYGCNGSYVVNTVMGEDSVQALVSAIVVAGAQLKMHINAGTFIAPEYDRLQSFGFPDWAPYKAYVDTSFSHAPSPVQNAAHSISASGVRSSEHDSNPSEFNAYPPACVSGTENAANRSPKRSYIKNVIASRQFIYRDDAGKDYYVDFCLGKPQFDQRSSNWKCKYELTGPNDNVRRYMIGCESLDSLVMALCFAPTELVCSRLYPDGARLIWPQLANFGFPYVPQR